MSDKDNIFDWRYSKIVFTVIVLFVIGDLFQSGYEIYKEPILGDIVPLVLPDARNAPILKDPFGIKALSIGQYHPNINRFFCNITLYYYMRKVPHLLQNFVNPVQSIYLSILLFKLLVLVSILFVLMRYIVFESKNWKTYALALCFVMPYLQISGGLFGFLAIIDSSIVYLVFYAFPILLLMILAWPFYSFYRIGLSPKMAFWKIGLLFALGLVVSFSSAVIPPSVLIITSLYFLDRILTRFGRLNGETNIPVWHLVFMIYMWMLNTYSLFLGTFNTESSDVISLLARYKVWLKGMEKFFLDGSFTVMIVTMIVCLIIAQYKNLKIWKGKFPKFLVYSAIFTLSYLILLPIGGFREYRPLILRNDTIMPVTLLCLIIVGTLLISIYRQVELKNLRILSIWLFLSIATYTWMDVRKVANEKICEEKILYDLYHAGSEVKVLEYDKSCNVTAWIAVREPSYYENHAIMWQYWNIIDHKILLSFRDAPW